MFTKYERFHSSDFSLQHDVDMDMVCSNLDHSCSVYLVWHCQSWFCSDFLIVSLLTHQFHVFFLDFILWSNDSYDDPHGFYIRKYSNAGNINNEQTETLITSWKVKLSRNLGAESVTILRNKTWRLAIKLV